MVLSLRRPLACLLAITWLTASLSCGATAPSMPTTEMDNGTLAPGAYNVYPFNASAGGNITITLVSLSQPIAVEISLGVVNSGSCTVQASVPAFTVGTQWMNAVSAGGTYCVEIDDVATPNPPTSLAYSITIQHP